MQGSIIFPLTIFRLTYQDRLSGATPSKDHTISCNGEPSLFLRLSRMTQVTPCLRPAAPYLLDADRRTMPDVERIIHQSAYMLVEARIKRP